MAVKDAAGGEEEDGKALYLAKCVHKGGAVMQAVCGHIRSPLTVDVVFGKETLLELVVFAADGSVQSVCQQPVFGAIKDLKLLPWNEQQRALCPQTYAKDLLVVLSDSGNLSFLTFDVELHRFLAVSHVHLSHPGVSLRQLGWLLAVESRARAVAVAAFEDQVAIFPTSSMAGSNIVDKAVNYPAEALSTTVTPHWGIIWSIVFLSSASEGPTLPFAVLLNGGGAPGNEIHILSFDQKERSIQAKARFPSNDSLGAGLTFQMAEIPSLPDFILLFRVGDIMVLKVSAAKGNMLPLASLELASKSDGDTADKRLPMVSGWAWEPSSREPRLVFSLNTGNVYVASWKWSDEKPELVINAGFHRCSPCNVLLWSKGGFIAAMVEMGDGQVLKLESGALTFRSVIQNIAPVIDFTLVDNHGDKQDKMFACCGAAQEGSVRIIRNGNRVERLISTPPVYEGVSAIWTVRISFRDPYHAFFVISFVEQTRVLSVGLNFVDITDAVGFDSSVTTLACGLVQDHWVCQVRSTGVKLCSPTKAAHPSGIDQRNPICTTWRPQGYYINLGAISRGKVILSLSRPGLLIMLGVRELPSGCLELMELQHCLLDAEVSCISVPEEDELPCVPVPPSIVGLYAGDALPAEVDVGRVCVVGTRKPSVEILSLVPADHFSSLAVGFISLISSIGTAVTGCIPQDVRLVLFDRLYVLAGLRNGMLLRYEWPYSRQAEAAREEPAQLNLIAVRPLGVSPVFLIPLAASPRANIIALSDRPWLLEIARHSQRLAYTSISFQPSTHVTPVSSLECPNGAIFMADNCMHLVELEQSNSLNVQKLQLGATPHRVIYHCDSRTLLVLQVQASKDKVVAHLRCIDPVSGAPYSCHAFAVGEVPKCMHLLQMGGDHLLLVGTATSAERPTLPTGEFESSQSRGHLVVTSLVPKGKKCERQVRRSCHCRINGEWGFSSKCVLNFPGPVLAVNSYLGRYVLASSGNILFCLGATPEAARFKRIASVKTRFSITNIAVHLTTIAVGDCRDGILFYVFDEDSKKFELLESDPMQRVVADCALLDLKTAAVMDRCGNFCALTSWNAASEGCGSPERNLVVSCWFHLGEISMSIRKGHFAYKSPGLEEGFLRGGDLFQHNAENSSLVASTLHGSVYVFIRVTREEYNLLEAVQAKLAVHPLTAPVLGNNHARYRRQGSPAVARICLDGDMLAQFLELTSVQQLAVLKDEQQQQRREGWGQEQTCTATTTTRSSVSVEQAPVEQVLRMLERVHHALT